MGYEFGGVVTERGEERAIGYHPVLAVPAGGGGAPSDGVWLTGQVAVANTFLPGPGNYSTGHRAVEPPAWPRWVGIGIIVWLFCLGAVFGLVVTALFRGG